VLRLRWRGRGGGSLSGVFRAANEDEEQEQRTIGKHVARLDRLRVCAARSYAELASPRGRSRTWTLGDEV
jgi:hypothetical protein